MHLTTDISLSKHSTHDLSLTPETLAQLTLPRRRPSGILSGRWQSRRPCRSWAQEILEHASASTTAIWLKAREKRIAEAAENYYAAAEAETLDRSVNKGTE